MAMSSWSFKPMSSLDLNPLMPTKSESNCLVTDTPLNHYKNLLEYSFPEAHYLAKNFNEAMENSSIRNAFNSAVYNFYYAHIVTNQLKTPASEFYTETSHTTSYTTKEGNTVAVIKWIEEGKEAKVWDDFDKPLTRETILFLSNQEIVFIPGTTDFADIDQLQYYSGMYFLYNIASSTNPLRYVHHDIVKEIANHREVVQKLGKYHDPSTNYGKVKLSYQVGEMRIYIEEYNKKELHTFTKYYQTGLAAIFNFFRPTVAYEKINLLENERDKLFKLPKIKI